MDKYTVTPTGDINREEYRIYLQGPNGLISPWHDIPLFADESKKVYNMVVEIPKDTFSNFKISLYERINCIKRADENRFKKEAPYTFGALPQTWKDPNHLDSNTNAKGDNDPIDVTKIGSQIQKRGAVVPVKKYFNDFMDAIEISGSTLKRGSVYEVKVLGAIIFHDDDNKFWHKLIAVAKTEDNSDLYSKLNDIKDVEKDFPDLLKTTEEWFRIYKIPTGKPANEIAFNGEFKDAEFANGIIAETHKCWKDLMKDTATELQTEAHVDGAARPAIDKVWQEVYKRRRNLGSN